MRITICSSMVFSKELIEIEKELIEQKHEVILPEFVREYAKMNSTDEMHKESAKNKIKYNFIKGYFDKIKNSDAVLIVNKKRKDIDNYIGGNTLLEMGFAHVLNKKIFLLNPIPNMNYSDEVEAMKPIIINGDLNKINL